MTQEQDGERAFRRRRSASLATLIAYAREEADALGRTALSELLARAEQEALADRTAPVPAGAPKARSGPGSGPRRPANGEHRTT